ncbi:glycosyltransferase family 2 protein [Patescibacteria group bacterium]|nr:glycosyltransferase family 2 protein [Patescibacteria group bacterium]
MPPRPIFVSPPNEADLAVILVGYNVRDLTLRNLESLFASENSLKIQLILVDNDSKDGTAEAVQTQFPDVYVIRNTSNTGFSHAVNQGIAVARARHVLLLNPDMRVSSDALAKFVDYADGHEEVGVIGGKLLTEDGRLVTTVRRFPDVWSQLALILKLPHLFPKVLARYLQQDLDPEREQAVDSLRGSFFLITAEALKCCPGLDPRYFIFFEEVDFCRQMKVQGLSVRYVPSITAVDYVGRSFKQQAGYWNQKQFTKSMVQYFQKWEPAWQSWLLRLARPFGLCSLWSMDRLRAIASTFRAKLKA